MYTTHVSVYVYIIRILYKFIIVSYFFIRLIRNPRAYMYYVFMWTANKYIRHHSRLTRRELGNHCVNIDFNSIVKTSLIFFALQNKCVKVLK